MVRTPELVWGTVAIVGFIVALIRAIFAHRALAPVLGFTALTYAVVSAFPFTPQLYRAYRKHTGGGSSPPPALQADSLAWGSRKCLLYRALVIVP